MEVIKFIFNLILLFLSYLNLWRANKKNIRKGNYFILKNTDNLIDPRTIKFSNINKNDLSKNINFVRSVSLKLGLKAILNLRNIFILNALHDVILYKNKFLNRDLSKTKKEYFYKIFLIIKSSKIEKFTMIDDYRLMNLFLPILKKLNIDSCGYMHGRISNNLKFQENLKKYKFDKYYVWNEYFKKKILKINREYKNEEIIVKNPLKKYKVKSDVKNNGLMLVEEDKVSLDLYKKIIYILKKQKKFKIYFKFRPNNKINIKLSKFLKKNNVKYYHKENIYKLFPKLKIKILTAFNSSLLIECSYYNVVPIMLTSKRLFFKEFVLDKVVFQSKVTSLSKFVLNLNSIYKSFYLKKKRIWDKK